MSGPMLDLGTCDTCGDRLTGGSHYHCGRCHDPKTTSQYGHYGRFSDGTWGFSCDPANLGKSYGYKNLLRVTDESVRLAAS